MSRRSKRPSSAPELRPKSRKSSNSRKSRKSNNRTRSKRPSSAPQLRPKSKSKSKSKKKSKNSVTNNNILTNLLSLAEDPSIEKILSYLSCKEIYNARRVSKSTKKFIDENIVKILHMLIIRKYNLEVEKGAKSDIVRPNILHPNYEQNYFNRGIWSAPKNGWIFKKKDYKEMEKTVVKSIKDGLKELKQWTPLNKEAFIKWCKLNTDTKECGECGTSMKSKLYNSRSLWQTIVRCDECGWRKEMRKSMGIKSALNSNANSSAEE